MDFRILGPVEVDDVTLGGPRQRAVLAALLLHANEPVSAERLVVALWGEEAPPTAIKSLHVTVSRLRSALGAADIIETTASGYCVRVARGELDLDRFEHAAAAGRESLAAGRPDRAAEQLREALGVWRGPPLADLAAMPFAAAEIARRRSSGSSHSSFAWRPTWPSAATRSSSESSGLSSPSTRGASGCTPS